LQSNLASQLLLFLILKKKANFFQSLRSCLEKRIRIFFLMLNTRSLAGINYLTNGRPEKDSYRVQDEDSFWFGG
jgi:hypothetical protein